MTQEFVTLPREVVEQALKALKNVREQLGSTVSEFNAIEAIRAALEQPQNHIEQHLGMVPAGWKLVPVTPTPEMIQVMCAYDGTQYSNTFDSDDFKEDYRNMLDAAPQPPVVDRPQGEQEPVAWIENLGGGISYSAHHEAARKLPEGVIFDLYTHPQPKREPLTDDQIDAIADAMPGGLEGFMKGWGWRQFARAVIEATNNIK